VVPVGTQAQAGFRGVACCSSNPIIEKGEMPLVRSCPHMVGRGWVPTGVKEMEGFPLTQLGCGPGTAVATGRWFL
jgi:hypothetical protein